MVWRLTLAVACKVCFTELIVLLLGGLKLVPRPGVFALFDFHKVDVTLVEGKLT